MTPVLREMNPQRPKCPVKWFGQFSNLATSANLGTQFNSVSITNDASDTSALQRTGNAITGRFTVSQEGTNSTDVTNVSGTRLTFWQSLTGQGADALSTVTEASGATTTVLQTGNNVTSELSLSQVGTSTQTRTLFSENKPERQDESA